MAGFVEAKEAVAEGDGKSEAEEVTGGIGDAGGADGFDDSRAEDAEPDGGVDPELGAKEGEQFLGRDAEPLLCPASFPEVGEGDPLVLGVPNDGRDGEQEESSEHPEKTSAFQEASSSGTEREVGGHGEDASGVGPFAEEAQSGECAGCHPPSGGGGGIRVKIAEGAVGLVGGVEEGEHGSDPEEDGEGIDGHEDAADVEDGKEVEGDDGPDCGACSEQAAGEEEGDDGGSGGEEGREETDAECVVAGEGDAEFDDGSDAGTFTVVAVVEVLRPEAVIDFVGREFDDRCEHPAEQGGDGEREEKKGGGVHCGEGLASEGGGGGMRDGQDA